MDSLWPLVLGVLVMAWVEIRCTRIEAEGWEALANQAIDLADRATQINNKSIDDNK